MTTKMKTRIRLRLSRCPQQTTKKYRTHSVNAAVIIALPLLTAEQELVDVMKERNEAARRAGHSFNSLAGLPGNTATPRRYCRIINAKRPSPGCPGFKDTSRLVVCHVCEKKVNASYINRHLRRVHLLKAKEWKQIYGDFPST